MTKIIVVAIVLLLVAGGAAVALRMRAGRDTSATLPMTVTGMP